MVHKSITPFALNLDFFIFFLFEAILKLVTDFLLP